MTNHKAHPSKPSRTTPLISTFQRPSNPVGDSNPCFFQNRLVDVIGATDDRKPNQANHRPRAGEFATPMASSLWVMPGRADAGSPTPR